MKITAAQYNVLHEAIMYQNNKVNIFNDNRVLKALSNKGLITEINSSAHGFNFQVTTEAVEAMIMFIMSETIGARVQVISKITSKFLSNSQKTAIDNA